MDEFYESNPGLSHRIATHVDFLDHTINIFFKISKMMLEEHQFQLTAEVENSSTDCINKRKETLHLLIVRKHARLIVAFSFHCHNAGIGVCDDMLGCLVTCSFDEL